jgi:alpha-glucosidase
MGFMADADWWRGALIYQIYPRSFQDTSGDGVGDLRGIVQRMDHIAELGADAIWISPFVASPMKDFGYDVSDYLAVDPMFGTLDDFRAVLRAAHDRGLKVMMDQVLSHTSDQHPWFLESRESRDNSRADWYVWADARDDGGPPNNWLSVFGGSSWQWEPRRAQYYLHNFLAAQPDLNFHNPEVRKALLDVCRFWLDLGVDGFRLDVCAFYFHDKQLRDNPPSPVKPTGAHFMFNPYSLQRHVRDIAQPENLGFLEDLRALTDSYEDRVLLGELHETDAAKLHAEYTAPGRLQLAYGYWLLGADHLDAELVRATARQLGHEMDDGWPAWALDNHDFTRAPSRMNLANGAVAPLAALSCLRGALCFYQGAELGLPQADVPFDRVVDPYGRAFWPSFKGRDGCRTPMPWTPDGAHAGFSDAEPWLPIPEAHRALAVETQAAEAGSTLNRMRRFLQWRKRQPALRQGAMRFLDAPEPVLAFERGHGDARLLCVFNLGAEEARFTPPEAGEPVEGHGMGWAREDGAIVLPGDGGYVGALP